MSEERAERRRFARVRVRAPLFARVVSRSLALSAGGVVDGVLIDASRGGVAFAAHDPLAIDDVVEISVERPDRSGVLAHVRARVVAVEPGAADDLVVRCEFTEPTNDEHWISQLLAAAPAPARGS
jgi:hypothetical protein